MNVLKIPPLIKYEIVFFIYVKLLLYVDLHKPFSTFRIILLSLEAKFYTQSSKMLKTVMNMEALEGFLGL